MWNSFCTHLIAMGKEPATEELRVLLVQHVLYIRTGLNFFSNKKKI